MTLDTKAKEIDEKHALEDTFDLICMKATEREIYYIKSLEKIIFPFLQLMIKALSNRDDQIWKLEDEGKFKVASWEHV